MNPKTTPQTIPIPLGRLIDLGVEYWRLATWVSAAGSASRSAGAARHALRRMEDFFHEHQLEIRHLDGHPFDPGIAARVVHNEDDPELPAGMVVVSETVSPMVLFQGKVVREAEVVTRRGVRK